MQRLGLSSNESTKFNLGFNGFVGRMIKRIKERNKDKYDELKKNQLQIQTENNTKKKGNQDWASSSEDENNDNEDLEKDMERIDRKTIVMKLGTFKQAHKNTDLKDKNNSIVLKNDPKINDNKNSNEIIIKSDPGEE